MLTEAGKARLTATSVLFERLSLTKGTSGQDPLLTVQNQPLEIILFLNLEAAVGNPFHITYFKFHPMPDPTPCVWKVPYPGVSVTVSAVHGVPPLAPTGLEWAKEHGTRQGGGWFASSSLLPHPWEMRNTQSFREVPAAANILFLALSGERMLSKNSG